MRHLISLFVLTMLSLGCSSTDFGAVTGKSASSKAADEQEDAGADGGEVTTGQETTGGGGGVDANDAGTDSGELGEDDAGAGPEDDIVTEEQKAVRRTECWFAVSGTYIGTDFYASTFPDTKSGEPIGHKEGFDTVGGVFLAARDEPYVQGGGEIDVAIAQTFDSIAVAPGMRAEIKDGSGNVLFSGDGPALRISTEYGNTNWHMVTNSYQQRMGSMPEWMQELMDGKQNPERIPLHAARSVKVSKIKGKRCDFD